MATYPIFIESISAGNERLSSRCNWTSVKLRFLFYVQVDVHFRHEILELLFHWKIYNFSRKKAAKRFLSLNSNCVTRRPGNSCRVCTYLRRISSPLSFLLSFLLRIFSTDNRAKLLACQSDRVQRARKHGRIKCTLRASFMTRPGLPIEPHRSNAPTIGSEWHA